MLIIAVAIPCLFTVSVFAADMSIYKPENVILSSGDKNLTFTWKNPSATTIEKITIYDITSGEEVFVTDSINTTPSKYILYQITGLTNNQYNQYKIVFEYTDADDYTFFMSGMPTTKTTETYEEISFVRNGASTKMLPASMTIDVSEKHSGEASVKISSAFVKDPAYSNYTGSSWGYSAITYKLPLVADKKYKISYWAKSKNNISHVVVHMGWAYFEEEGKKWGAKCSGGSDWTKYEHTYDYSGTYVANSKNLLYFVYESTCDGFWFDDLEVYELDEAGNKVGDNLAVNGGFEVFDGVVDIEMADTDNDVNSAVISWSVNDEESVIGTNIYREVDGEYDYIGRFAKGTYSYTPDNLLGGNTYNFKLAAVNTYGVEGEPAFAVAEPLLPPYETGNVVLKKGTDEVTKLNGDGEYKANIALKNNSVAGGQNVEILVVLSDSGGVLKKVYSASKCVAISALPEEISVPFTLTEDINSVEVFVFDSRTTLNILCNSNLYTK